MNDKLLCHAESLCWTMSSWTCFRISVLFQYQDDIIVKLVKLGKYGKSV